MSNFIPAQFTSFTNNFDMSTLNTDSNSSFMTKVRDMKKPNDFFDFSRMSQPSGIMDLQQRVSYNLSYFTSNYLAIILMFFLYCILTNIKFFLFVAVEAGAFYYIQNAFGNTDELNLPFFTLHKNVWYSILLIVNIPVFFIYSPLSSVFWLSIFSGLIIIAHAAIMDKPVEAAYSNVV